MRTFDSPLPIDAVLGDLAAALAARSAAVLVAPPGAGKTTRVPLALLDAPWVGERKIVVLEPRRIAARASAERMAKTLGEKVGDTVGYRVRFGSKVSRRTRIEVVTEGIFTRQILDDPELSGIAAVLFDEFHERSLDADLGLALARDAQQGLREDLRILVMSATLDGARVARLLGDAPVVESEGRAFPVETRYLGRKTDLTIERQMADAIAAALRADTGSVLAFLPGAAEIRRTQTMLSERIHDASIEVVPLFGAMEAAAQDRAIAPAPRGSRKVVLATSIAETSLTIEGVRIVVDCGLARVPRYEPDIGLTRLETVRASRAAVDQRRGRAGRTEPGVCYRLWDEPQTASFEPYTRPEILSSDLSPLLLDLAQWGVRDPGQLAFLDPPPAPALSEARALLEELDALDGDGRITAEGKSLRALALPPRLARMIVDSHRLGGGAEAAAIAAILTERGLGGDSVDLEARRDQFRRDRSPRAAQARQLAERWAGQVAATEGDAPDLSPPSTGVMLALAFPDRVARNRGNGSFVLANGRGAAIEPTSALARAPFVAVAELTGTAAQGRILLAAQITLAEIEAQFAGHITTDDEITFDRNAAALRARRRTRLHAIVLSEQPLSITPSAESATVLAQGLIDRGLDRLPWSKPLKQWRDRVMFLRAAAPDEWPDLSDTALAARRDDWLVPALFDKTALSQLSAGDLSDAVMNLLPWQDRGRLDREAPTHFEAPTGSMIPIDYEAEEGAKISVRLQELFGLNRHPSVAQDRVPLVVELLSPAHRPVQVTRDLPGFWRGSYAAVRSDLRGRYPRHPWPEDPASAAPTRRAKPRGT
ncbi:ATP-dependent helicase HrpB [Bradyrhizobium sp. U87765 SZCCT0131]|uniref:ATP-dependent helicase HrpB n=1 Tax=unclassified Bradyrhizobium TaxID=2631580 RepID=UPI001BA860B6|nr:MULTISPECIES: ATP-dependent helicase HrpB [unclassified Bradyrhizobium]MBR1217383.1 ATP-dependent helicase HrpB [Bradyrhizobium sp. U87765 SZCCT0131]MBR1265020.1 ATP-dependent helicase HrpB [Bradyrhizobium sp. U87765 SZCCT0134]MBR1305002.1 ATP-dependent helicase HrpB [Bradyrhizobium sp. U87765 SZCCT0110]MBR1320788.1 ATP-dependent helicase HrpB [Bradyrhizobium sp. U87765 SZCCT0109]MBR1349208.1 ATP-dependent helicase HrpB [Bradyrhizobium sp. U87765 SZCCT0048]